MIAFKCLKGTIIVGNNEGAWFPTDLYFHISCDVPLPYLTKELHQESCLVCEPESSMSGRSAVSAERPGCIANHCFHEMF